MANVRLNVFDNLPSYNVNFRTGIGNGSLQIHEVLIPGSISFNNVAVMISQSDLVGGNNTISVSFGLYSQTGNTLSLANSASGSSNLTVGTAGVASQAWLTLVTSAGQDITPGNWFFAFMSSSSGAFAGNSILVNTLANVTFSQGAMGGPFVRGYFSVSTGDLPTSIATSDMLNEGGSTFTTQEHFSHPYIVIGA